jgi:formate/nitrite transporter FocA (FNT family)
MIHNTDANEITFNFIINIVGAILVYLVLKFKSDEKENNKITQTKIIRYKHKHEIL